MTRIAAQPRNLALHRVIGRPAGNDFPDVDLRATRQMGRRTPGTRTLSAQENGTPTRPDRRAVASTMTIGDDLRAARSAEEAPNMVPAPSCHVWQAARDVTKLVDERPRADAKVAHSCMPFDRRLSAGLHAGRDTLARDD